MKKIVFVSILCFGFISAFSQAIYNIDTKRINNDLLGILCDDELKWVRNEIYARHGYVFTTKEIQARFERESWYQPVSDNSQVKLSTVEQANVAILKNEEDKRNARANAIKAYFKKMKAGVAKKDPAYNFVMQREGFISKILNNIDIDDMHFCGGNGLYEKKLDNGFSDISYSLKLDGKEIFVMYCSLGVSSIFPETKRHAVEDDDFVAQKRVGEYLDFWKFSIDEDNNIKFVEIGSAG